MNPSRLESRAYYLDNPHWLPVLGWEADEEVRRAAQSRGSQRRMREDILEFVAQAGLITLRAYQQAVARAVVDSVLGGKGLSFVVLFPRQSGKNELQAQIECYLLARLAKQGAEMVQVSPTWKPQSLNAMRRLERVLRHHPRTRKLWHKEQGYVYRLGEARIYFLSGEPTSNVVGATASTLLSCDEAQEVLTTKWDKELAPMAASTNATRVFWGTAWNSQTLLARELRAARELEAADGIRRAFVLTADEVAQEVPAYGRFVEEQVRRLGRMHPLVRTQFFSEQVEAQGGMFDEARLRLVQGTHARRSAPEAGKLYALLVDVGGECRLEAQGAGRAEAQPEEGARDATALVIVEVDVSTLADAGLGAPTYRVVGWHTWTGAAHSALYAEIKALAEHWQSRYVVIDATGVGAGLASFLEKALPGRVLPFVFTQKSKSDLGWRFMAIVETGRFKLPVPSALALAEDERMLSQLQHCQAQVLEGPGRTLRWGVPDGTRHAATGALVHDDLALSAALCAVLDEQSWGLASSEVAAAVNLFDGMREVY